MIKSILVALDGSEHAAAALDYGLWMAQRTNGRVTGLHVIDIVSIEGSFMHDISGSLGFEPYLDFSAKMREALRERGEVLLDAFEKRCRERGTACDRVLAMGIVANEICEHARIADLVAVGPPDSGRERCAGQQGRLSLVLGLRGAAHGQQAVPLGPRRIHGRHAHADRVHAVGVVLWRSRRPVRLG